MVYNSTIINWKPEVASEEEIEHDMPDALTNLDDTQFIWNGDFNGDGKSDLFMIKTETDYGPNNYFQLYLSTTVDNDITYSTPPISLQFSEVMHPQLTQIGDFDGDGISEILIVYTVSDNFPNNGMLYFCVYKLTGSTLVSTRSFYCAMPTLEDDFDHYHLLESKIVVGDFNGDGVDDIIAHMVGKYDDSENFPDPYSLDRWFYIESFLNLATGYINFNTYIESQFYGNMTREYRDQIKSGVTLDFNGDGKQDFIICWTIYTINDQHQPIALTGLNCNYFYFNEELPLDKIGKKLMFGDFNGDGKSDIIWYSSVSHEWLIKYSDSKFFANETQLTNSATINDYNTVNDEKQHLYISDFNGDGKCDVMFYNNTVEFEYERDPYTNEIIIYNLGKLSGKKIISIDAPNYFYFFYSKGLGFTDYSAVDSYYAFPYSLPYIDYLGGFESFFDNSYLSFYLNDVNGDGNVDFLGTWLIKGAPQFSGFYFNYYLFHSNEENLHVSTITDGLNNTINIDYKLLNQQDEEDDPFYSSLRTAGHNNFTYPFMTYKGSMYVVDEVWPTTETQTNKITSQQYNYYGLTMHKRGKGNLGFQHVIEKSLYDGDVIAEKRDAYALYPGYLFPYLTHSESWSKENSSSSLVHISSTDVDEDDVVVYNLGSSTNPDERYFQYQSLVTSENTLTGDITEQETDIPYLTSSPFYGDVASTTQRVYTGGTTLLRSSTTEYTYTSPISGKAWQTAPSSVTTTETEAGVSAYARTKNFSYDGIGRLITEIADPSLPKACTTAYTYNNYGLVTSSTLSSAGLPTLTSQSFYDRKSMFVVKKTDPAGQSEYYSYDPVYGNVIKATCINGLSGYSYYDINGFPTSSVSTRGKTSTVSTNFINTSVANQHLDCDLSSESGFGQTFNKAEVLYEIVKTSEGAPGTREFFNSKGQLLRSCVQYYNFPGGSIQYSYVDYFYDELGNLVEKTAPYFITNSYPYHVIGHLKSSVTAYDYRGRPTTESYKYHDGTNYVTITIKTFEYDDAAKAVTVHNWKGGSPYKTTTKTSDAAGRLKKSEEDGQGSVNYEYGSNNKPLIIIVKNDIDEELSRNTFEYDEYGNQIELVDADAGTKTYSYNAYGQLIEQEDEKHNEVQMTYDNLGRVKRKQYAKMLTPPAVEVTNVYYTYVKSGNGIGQISEITSSDYGSTKYTYNIYGDVLTYEKRAVNDGVPMTVNYVYTYDDYGRLASKKFPYNYTLNYTYNSLGMMTQISSGGQSIWLLNEINAAGQVIKTKSGASSNIVSERTYKDDGTLAGISATAIPGTITDYEYNFEIETGNLSDRTDNVLNTKENFHYDEMDRLDCFDIVDEDLAPPYNMLYYGIIYNNNGTIQKKIFSKNSNLYDWDFIYGVNYNNSHKIVSIQSTAIDPSIPKPLQQDMSYNVMDKVESIEDVAIPGESEPSYTRYKAEFFYGTDEKRNAMNVYKEINGTDELQIKKYYFGDYEVEIYENLDFVRRIHYIRAGGELIAVYVKTFSPTGNNDTLYYVFKDHLGSITAITDNQGNVVRRYNYDPWGQNRSPDAPLTYQLSKLNPAYYELVPRGFTGHEMLPEFGLINMLGRVYDPTLGVFLSPDNYVQASVSVAGYNRYGYCMNNPLKYTDPSGEFFFSWIPIIGPIIDAACLASVIDAGVQVVKIAAGWQNGFSWGEVAGTFAGAFVGAGLGLMSPSFEGLNLVGKYTLKAVWSGAVAVASSIAGQLVQTKIETNRWDIRNFGSILNAGLIAMGISVATSIYDYITWDSKSIDEKIKIVSEDIDAENVGVKVSYNPNIAEDGRLLKGTNKIEFGPSGLKSRSLANITGEHEITHFKDISSGILISNDTYSNFETFFKNPVTNKSVDKFTQFLEYRAYMREFEIASSSFTPSRFIEDSYKVLKECYGYKGPYHNAIRAWNILANILR